MLRSSEEQTAGRASLTRLRCSTSPFSRAHTEAFSGGSRDCAVTSRQASDGASGVHTPETPSDLLSVQSGSHQGPNLANDDPGVPGAPGSTPPKSLPDLVRTDLSPKAELRAQAATAPAWGQGHGMGFCQDVSLHLELRERERGDVAEPEGKEGGEEPHSGQCFVL